MDDYRIRRFEGQTGRVWILDEREQADASGGQTTPFYGWPEGDERNRHWVQRAMGETETWKDERDHVRRAFGVGQLPEVAASPFLHGAIDLLEPFDLYLVSELAETDLRRVLLNGPLDRDELANLEERLRRALDVLHGLRLVHSDLCARIRCSSSTVSGSSAISAAPSPSGNQWSRYSATRNTGSTP